jgi:hypothetical protein
MWYLVAILVLVLMAIALVIEFRTSPEEEAKRIARQNKAMTTMKDDVNEPARWVP